MLEEITRVFNNAFADYVIPMHLSEDVMAKKLLAENVQLQYSPGLFINNNLVGFILNATDQKGGEYWVYNAGTGVLPQHRGQHYARQLYNFSFSLLKKLGYPNHRLEVLTDNARAIAVYQSLGFATVRNMNCYKATVHKDLQATAAIRPIPIDETLFSTFWDITPSWQNSISCIQRLLADHTVVGLFAGKQLAGYAIYVQPTGRLKQLAVGKSFRRRGYATQLLHHVQNHTSATEVVVTCVQENAGCNAFFTAMGFQAFVPMFEMEFRMD